MQSLELLGCLYFYFNIIEWFYMIFLFFFFFLFFSFFYVYYEIFHILFLEFFLKINELVCLMYIILSLFFFDFWILLIKQLQTIGIEYWNFWLFNMINLIKYPIDSFIFFFLFFLFLLVIFMLIKRRHINLVKKYKFEFLIIIISLIGNKFSILASIRYFILGSYFSTLFIFVFIFLYSITGSLIDFFL